jgi:hypothetical protein
MNRTKKTVFNIFGSILCAVCVQVLPGNDTGGIFVVADTCSQNNTYRLDGAEVVHVGQGDHHDRKYDEMVKFFEFEFDTAEAEEGHYCHQHMHIFPSDALKKKYETSTPFLYATVILLLFLFTACVFLVYDWIVTNHQSRTQAKANKTQAIVQELFPGHVAAKLFQAGRTDSAETSEPQDLLDGRQSTHGAKSPTTTIAELYPASTVLCK